MTDIEIFRSRIAKLADSPAPSPADIKRLRMQFGGERSGELVQLARLQKKACQKFGPGVWWVTEKSLQQATPWPIAKLKAQWIGNGKVYDLCSGIGGDAMQLALRAGRTGEVVAVDADPTVLQYAEANLQFVAPRESGGRATTVCADVRSVAIEPSASVHIDPDRRVHDLRTTRPEDYGPPLAEVMPMVGKARSAIVKLAPAAELPESICRSGHRCWMSLSGSVREQTVLLGETIERAGLPAGAVSAAVVRSDGGVGLFSQERLGVRAKQASAPMVFLVDPDAAIRAAGLTETFAEVHSLQTLGGPAGFLTGEHFDEIAPLAIVGRVVWSGSCDQRKLRKAFRARNWYPETIKVRGTDHDPAKWRKQFRGCGEMPVTLWIGRAGDRVFAAVSTFER